MKTLAVVVAIFIASLTSPATAEDPVYFVESELREAVEAELWVLDPTPTDMLGLTFLSIGSGDIANLAGLECAVNLQRLEITHNRLSDISPLAGLDNLQTLILNNNRIGDISDLSGLTKLRYLDLHDNQGLSDISAVSGLVNLQSLILRCNQIGNASAASNLVELETLDLRSNDLSDISALSGLPNLRTLDASINSISAIPAGFDLPAIETLNLADNQISVLSGSFGLDSLGTLDLSNNDIESVSDLSGLSSLTTLDLANNNISTISGLSSLSTLRDLDLHMNRITDISPLLSLTSLTALQLQSNPLGYEAQDVHIPQIIKNNPGIRLDYDVSLKCSVSISSTAGGSVIVPGEGTFVYTYGDSVTLRAEANPGFTFTTWSGSVHLNLNPLSLTVSQDYRICAHFVSTSTIIHVDDDAPDDTGPCDPAVGDPDENGTPAHPFDSIQEAIEVADDGATVQVRPGVYRETIDFLGKRIALTGIDPNDPNAAPFPVLDAAGMGPAVTFARGEDPNCSLTGFVITRGRGDLAGAIYCKASSPTITNCLIVGNRVIDPNGAAVYCTGSHAVLVNCTITDNYGGPQGSGLRVIDSNVVVVNSILWGNTPGEIVTNDPDALSIAYSNIAGGWDGTGNIEEDPLFAQHGSWMDPVSELTAEPSDLNAIWIAGDYHLKSQAGRWDPETESWVLDDVTSPCIDAGNPLDPVGLELQPNGDIINMGAYGGTMEASLGR